VGRGRVGDPPAVNRFGELLDELEESHGSTRVKYVLALTILAGTDQPRGVEPYQSFDLLISIRDAVLHGRRERYDVHSDSPDDRAARLLRRLETAKVIPPAGENQGLPFLLRISAPSVGVWACNVAARMVGHIVSATPDGDLKAVLEFVYAERFKLISP